MAHVRLFVLVLVLALGAAIHRAWRALIGLVTGGPKQAVIRTPEERFAGLAAAGYPFKPNYFTYVCSTVLLPAVASRIRPRARQTR